MYKSSFLLYGATGYTGRLIAAEAKKAGLAPILGGRTAASLAPLARDLGLTYQVFSLEDRPAMDAALAETPLLLNCAGPFRRTAAPLIEGCLRAGTHYLDLAGEVPEFEAAAAHDEPARRAGVMLLPGVGFGVVPTDCVALYLKQQLPDATALTLAFKTVGGVSRGTAQTLFLDLHRDGHVRRRGRLQPARPAASDIAVDFGQGRERAALNPWRGDLSTAYHSTEIPTIETYTAFPAPVPALMAARPYLGWLWNSRPWQALLRGLLRRLPPGPDAETLHAGATHVWGRARNEAGETATARLHGPEAYLFTARAALAMARRGLAGKAPAGFQTPAGAYGADVVLEIEGVWREEA